MKAHRGQVAVYLAFVLLALAVLAFVNFNTFLAVRSKNRMMNAVDEAAITVARYQGYLLNEIGRENVDRLRMAVRGDEKDENDGRTAAEKLERMRELALFGPLKALAEANRTARDWGFDGGADDWARSGFADHVAEIGRMPDVYSQEGGLWPRYAQALGDAVRDAPCVLPGYMELARPVATGLYATRSFYDVLAAKAWCWFSVGNRRAYLDAFETVSGDGMEALAPPENSEAFSLHVTFMTWEESPWGGVFDEDWTNFVCQVTGLSPADFSKDSTVTAPDQVWAFYDDCWGSWSTTFNQENFPITGSVRPEYDVAGCVASCVAVAGLQHMETNEAVVTELRTMRVTAEAKPLGTVASLDGGGRVPVTAYNRFIACSPPDRQIFTEAQLVLMGAVPRSPGVSMEPAWYAHVRQHATGDFPAGCAYCRLWKWWQQMTSRREISDWLDRNTESCHPAAPGGKAGKGGYEYAH